MKKTFTLEIANPCSENFDKMTPNANGSFCNSCAKNVIDLSRKTNSEVAKFISKNKDKNICARLKATQLEEEFQYNEVSKFGNLKYAAVAASILIASNVAGQEKTPVKTEINQPIQRHIIGKVACNQSILVTIKGRLLEVKTNKPLSKKDYPNLTLSINGSQNEVKVNSKTGDFSIPVEILKNSKTFEVTIKSKYNIFSKTIPFDVNNIKENILTQNIIIDESDLSKVEVMMLGGLGINYVEGKKSSKS
ncbi:MAG: hypothetical protein EOO44_15515 [Flavobacterium sp.]|nr:MAG: hypothetical protein EOO44_15515 [Flavobacterium sp.]